MSEREIHLKNLNSESPTTRHRAARYFSDNPCQTVLEQLLARRKIEKVMHVKRAIETAVNKITYQVEPSEEKEEELEISDDLRRHFHKKAIEEFSSILLHELEPKIGFLKLAASREVENFPESKVHYHLDVLSGLLSAISSLRKASARPQKKETDITQLLRDTCAEEFSESVNFHLEGPEPFLRVCDPDLLKIVISNGLRNAFESIIACPDSENRTIVIAWGITEIDWWISIIDDGPGLRGTPESAFKIGTSNKDGHSGFGLAIIKQAMENMDGHAELSHAHTGGAQLCLRWPL